MGGWYRCERQYCDKTMDEDEGVVIHDGNKIRHVYCSKECAEADGYEMK